MSKINENTKMVDFPDVKLEKGETSTPVVENTAPQETHANTPTVKDVKDIVGGKGGSGSGDIVADNLFANDELEIGPSAGLGTNLREKVTPTRQVIATAGGLVVPTTAPTDETLVGIGTGREQIQIYLGDGLELVGDTSPYHIRVKNTPQIFEINCTAEDYDEEENTYVMHFNHLENGVYKINNVAGLGDGLLTIFSPDIMLAGHDPNHIIDTLNGISVPENERYVILNLGNPTYILIINGAIFSGSDQI